MLSLSVSSEKHVLISELSGDVTRRGSGELNPSLREQCARGKHEDNVEQAVNRIDPDVTEGVGWRTVVSQSTDRDRLTTVIKILPLSQQVDEHVGFVTTVQQLGEEVHVGDESGLENDRDIGRVEELNGITSVLSANLLVLDWEVDSESLEVDDNKEHQHRGENVRQVRGGLSVERFLECQEFVLTSENQVEESNESALELGSLSGVDSGWREGLPDNRLTDTRGDKQRDTASETISLLQEFVEEKDDHTSEEELDDD